MAKTLNTSYHKRMLAARMKDPEFRTEYERARREIDQVDSVIRRDGTAIAKARFAQSGFAQPPDATFTLRLSYGEVKGYQENGKAINETLKRYAALGRALIDAKTRNADPFALLGPQPVETPAGRRWVIRFYNPNAATAKVTAAMIQA